MTEENKKTKRSRSVLREYLELILETAIFVFFVMTFIVQAFQIPTGSMEPTLLVGDFLFVNKLIYVQAGTSLEKWILPRKNIQRYDIVVFKFPNDMSKDFVKRVIALEGERIEIKDKQVYINDEPIPENYKVHNDNEVYIHRDLYHYDDGLRDNHGPLQVPDGHCFVMGDNRDNSHDSRYWGFLPLNYIKGKPWLVYFSYRAERDAYLKTGFIDRLRKFIRYFPQARWSRLLTVVR